MTVLKIISFAFSAIAIGFGLDAVVCIVKDTLYEINHLSLEDFENNTEEWSNFR